MPYNFVHHPKHVFPIFLYTESSSQSPVFREMDLETPESSRDTQSWVWVFKLQGATFFLEVLIGFVIFQERFVVHRCFDPPWGGQFAVQYILAGFERSHAEGWRRALLWDSARAWHSHWDPGMRSCNGRCLMLMMLMMLMSDHDFLQLPKDTLKIYQTVAFLLAHSDHSGI